MSTNESHSSVRVSYNNHSQVHRKSHNYISRFILIIIILNIKWQYFLMSAYNYVNNYGDPLSSPPLTIVWLSLPVHRGVQSSGQNQCQCWWTLDHHPYSWVLLIDAWHNSCTRRNNYEECTHTHYSHQTHHWNIISPKSSFFGSYLDDWYLKFGLSVFSRSNQMKYSN